MSAAFAVLEDAYRGRDGGWKGSPVPVIGYVGNTVPVEAITASGALAWRIAPVAGSTAAADPWIESFSDPDVRLIFARWLEGAYDDLALLIVPRSTETQHKLYLALREAVRVGAKVGGLSIDRLVLYDLPHTQRATSRSYALARTRDLIDRLGEATGHRPNDDDLAQAIAQSNAMRTLLAELQRRRLEGRVAGRQAQVATGALRFMPPAAGRAALQTWLDEGSAEEPRPGARLLVKGVPLDHDELHALVDELGATIVAEDDDWGSRAAEPPIEATAPPLDGLVEHCFSQRPCPRIHPQPLAGSWFERALSRGGPNRPLHGVIFNLPRPDDIHGWTLPAERALAQAHGLPSIVLRDSAAAERGRLQTFIAGLRP